MDNELEEISMRLWSWVGMQEDEIANELKAMGQNTEKFPIKFKIKGGIDIYNYDGNLAAWNNKISSLEKNLSEFERHKRHLLRFAFALNKYAEASCHAKIFSQTIYYLDETVFILNLAYKLRDDQASLAQATSKLFSRLGAVGADKRHSPMKELKDWTLKQYQVGNWKAKKESANKAAHDLKERVLAQGKIIHPELAVLSEQNAQRTIAEWIRKSA